MKLSTLLLVVALLIPSISKSQSDTIKFEIDSTNFWITDRQVPKAVIQSTRSYRERLLADPYRPAYHFCLTEDEGHPGDPNGAFYHNGRYHLMYLYNRSGSGFSWGHVSSKDMLHWRHHPDALMPSDGDEGVFSGGAFMDDDGTAILSYWMLWGAKGIGLAKSVDNDFNEWKKMDANPVIKSTEWGITDMTDNSGQDIHVGSSDPSNIWKKDGKYYMLTGNLLVLRKHGSRGKGLPANLDEPPLPEDSLNYQGDWLDLFVSEDLEKWDYLHRFYESKREWTSKTEDNMCPSFLPLPKSENGGEISDKHLLLFISHNLGCQYYIGDYKKDRFFPENHGRMTWQDNAYFAPEAMVDDKGRQIMWTWMFDDRPKSMKNDIGWTGTYGLPRSLWLGEDGTLRMNPIKELEQLRLNEQSQSNVAVKSGSEVSLNKFSHELMELEVTIDPNEADQFGVKVGVSENGEEETIVYYDRQDKKLKVDTRKSGLTFGRKIIEEAPLELKKGEPLTLRIFIDRSIIEVYANNRQAIARRIYPTLGGRGISAFSKGGKVVFKTVKSWEMMPSNPY
ncbi:MAG: beta-fructofuranosidase [Cyclobacteriaceae bacterium]|jgi:beta-fructofuranosidase